MLMFGLSKHVLRIINVELIIGFAPAFQSIKIILILPNLFFIFGKELFTFSIITQEISKIIR